MLADSEVVVLAGAIALALAFVDLVQAVTGAIAGLFTQRLPDDEAGVLNLLNLFAQDMALRIGDRVIYLAPLASSALEFLIVLVVVAWFVARVTLDDEPPESGDEAAR